MDMWIYALGIILTLISVDARRRRISRRRSSRGRRTRTKKTRQRASTRIRGDGNRVKIVQAQTLRGKRRFNRRNGRTINVSKSRVNIKGDNNKVVHKQILKCGRKKREITEKMHCNFDSHDLNMDGVIPYEEFMFSTAYLKQIDTTEVFKLFDNLDGDGLITRPEFRIGAQMFTNLGFMDQCNFPAIASGPCFNYNI